MRIAAVVLAAGAAERFGGPSKMLAELGGEPLIARVTGALGASRVAPIIVVTGREAEAIESVLAARAYHCVHNPAWAEGMGGSVAAGVRALPGGIDGVLIVPGDMPFLTPDFLNEIMECFATAPEPSPIVFPQLPDGTQDNPVIWPKRFFPELTTLSGSTGGKALLKRFAAQTHAFPVSDARLLLDVDTPEDLASAQKLFRLS